VARRPFDSATHALGRTTDGGVRRGGRSNGRWRRNIERKEKVPRVGWLGPRAGPTTKNPRKKEMGCKNCLGRK
jgi:hypothetical protein